MKSGYKHGGKIAPYAKSNPKVMAEAHDKSEGPVLSAEATKEPMALGAKVKSMRLDRPGRKMGGRVGADCAPLSTAASVDRRSDGKSSN